MWLILGRAAAKLPVWAYAILVLLIAVGVAGMHLIGQRNEARQALATANSRIETLVRDNGTLKANNAGLEAGIKAQSESIKQAAAEAAKKQAAANAALARLEVAAREQAARIAALKEIQKQGDRAKGANYAFEARRALR